MKHQVYKHQDYPFLDERLEAYAESDYYPFHMPGHKRAELYFENPYKIDITEIEGFDNLHHAQDILLKSQERLSRLYQSRRSYYLVNGSTSGLLSAIGALVNHGDQVLIARNCHKAVYNAVKIFRLDVNYVYPQLMTCGIQGIIVPEEVENTLKKHPGIKLVALTSPTYDGIVSDIRELAERVHKYNAYLIIDEAHGAHFSLNEHFPESAIRQGADIVIQSLHKTLPSFTQTAALHVASSRIDCHKVEEMLRIFQTSSPSYILMAGMERCVKMLYQSGGPLFEEYYERLHSFYQSCKKFKCLYVLTAEDYEAYDVYDVDISKILISTLYAPIDGKTLYQKLLNEYHLQMEMYSAQYVLAMTSLMDTNQGFERLFHSLMEIDSELEESVKNHAADRVEGEGLFLERAYAAKKQIMKIADACDHAEETELRDCSGKVCAEYICLYPPGIPMIVPGEVITDEFIETLEECRKTGMNVQGTKDAEYRKILTIAHSDENGYSKIG